MATETTDFKLPFGPEGIDPAQGRVLGRLAKLLWTRESFRPHWGKVILSLSGNDEFLAIQVLLSLYSVVHNCDPATVDESSLAGWLETWSQTASRQEMMTAVNALVMN